MKTPPGTLKLAVSALIFLLSFSAKARLAYTGPSYSDNTPATCGGENEAACTIFTDFYWLSGSGSCDRGLKEFEGKCVNGSGDAARLNTGVDGFLNTGGLAHWTTWALNNQRNDLALDEPINWVMLLGAHNSYSNHADGYFAVTIKNQHYSLSDQLRLGVRRVEWDTHIAGAQDWMRLSHALDTVGCCATDRFYYSAVKELQTWLSRNPGEFVIVDFDEGGITADQMSHYDVSAKLGNPLQEYLGPLPEYLGIPKVYKPEDWTSTLYVCQSRHDAICYDRDINGNFTIPKTSGKTTKVNSGNAPRMPTRRELIKRGKQAMFVGNGNHSHAYIWSGAGGTRYSDGRNKVKAFNFDESCKITASDFEDIFKNYSYLWPLGTMIQDLRRLAAPRIREARSTADTFGADGWTGLINRDRAKELARCNVPYIALDFLYYAWDTNVGVCDLATTGKILDGTVYDEPVLNPCPNPDDRVKGLVWSWKEGDFGSEGYALMDYADGRWTSAAPTNRHHFACAVKRPSTTEGTDPLDWKDYQGIVWAITKAVGTWNQGDAICAAEYGTGGTYRADLLADLALDPVRKDLRDGKRDSSGNLIYTGLGGYFDVSDLLSGGIGFAVPVNGWQNDRLWKRWAVDSRHPAFKGPRTTGGSGYVWLNYRKVAGSTAWQAYERPPLALASAVECPNVDLSVDGGMKEGSTIAFKVNLKADCGTLKYDFKFGDGGSLMGTTDNPVSHTYQDNGRTIVLKDCTGPSCPTVDTVKQKACIDQYMEDHPDVDASTAQAACPDEAFPIDDIATIEPFHVEFTATDPQNRKYVSTPEVTITNVAPKVTSLTAAAINENGTAQLSGTFTDPGVLDTHTVTIHWGDGSAPQTLSLAANKLDFTATHHYPDDNPTATPSDKYTINVTIKDKDGDLDKGSTTLTVNNVAPQISNVTGGTIDENGVATVSGTISDPGSEDTFTLTINWADGNSDTYSLPKGTTSFSKTHQYKDDNPTGTSSDSFPVGLILRDDDTGSTTAGTTVRVGNVAPKLDVTGSTIDENGIAEVNGAITDPGSQDTFTLIIDWGEGTPQTYTYPAGTTNFRETHQYKDDNPTGTPADDYTAKLTLADDDTGTVAATAIARVNDLAPVTDVPTIRDETGAIIGQDVSVALVGLQLKLSDSFTDTGLQDTHTARVVWGDGNTTVPTLVQGVGTGSISDSHVYALANRYTVTAQVTDDDTKMGPGSAVIDVVKADGAINAAVTKLTAWFADPAINPETALLLTQTLNKLRGDNEGSAENGALDLLAKGNLNAALGKFLHAQQYLAQVNTIDVSRIQGLLALTAKALAVEAIARAEAITVKPAQKRKIQQAKQAVLQGDTLLAAKNYSGATGKYQEAIRTVQGIKR
jgi:hypothetical protein